MDYLLQYYSFRSRQLPYPRIAFDLNLSMLLPFGQFVKTVFSHFRYASSHGRFPSPYETGFYKTALKKGIPSLIFLIDPKGFTQQFVYFEKDRLEFLVETQKDIDRPIFILPQLIIYQRTPEKEDPGLRNILFGFRDNPSFIRKTVLFFRYQRRAILDFGLRHQEARAWKERTGGTVIGLFCCSVPEELIHAAGMLPVRLPLDQLRLIWIAIAVLGKQHPIGSDGDQRVAHVDPLKPRPAAWP